MRKWLIALLLLVPLVAGAEVFYKDKNGKIGSV
jgi:hypothetical protein